MPLTAVAGCRTTRPVPPARLFLWLWSLAGVGLGVHAAVVGPPPLWLPLGGLLVLTTVCTIGCLFPTFQIYADVVQRGTPGRRLIALTFDDGPHPESTRRVLSLLAEYDAKATFFVVGQKVERYPDVAREIVAAGHTLALHGYSHDRLYSLRGTAYVQRDLERSQAAIERACGVRPVLFRPPIGFVSHLTSIGSERAGVTLVTWSVRGLDGYAGAKREAVQRRVLPGLRDGAIVLLHDASEREDFVPVGIEALPEILESIRTAGLRAVTVDELLAAEAR